MKRMTTVSIVPFVESISLLLLEVQSMNYQSVSIKDFCMLFKEKCVLDLRIVMKDGMMTKNILIREFKTLSPINSIHKTNSIINITN